MKSETKQEIIFSAFTVMIAVGLIFMSGLIYMAVMPYAYNLLDSEFINKTTYDIIWGSPFVAIGLILIWSYIRTSKGYTPSTCRHCGKRIK